MLRLAKHDILLKGKAAKKGWLAHQHGIAGRNLF